MTFKFTPAHKVVGDDHKPGQQVVVTNPLGFTIQPSETTLAEYIHRKTRDEAFNQVARETTPVKSECCGNPLRTGPNGRGCENCPPQKLTFDLWFNMRWHGGTAPVSIATAREIWNTAQENK